MKLLLGTVLAILLLPLTLVVLPFLLFRVLFGLLGFALRVSLSLIVLPIVLLVGLVVLAVGTVAFWLAILAPLLPFALIAFAIWALLKLTSRPHYV